MANKTLTAKVKFDTKSAEASLTRLEKKLKRIDKIVNTKTTKSGIEKSTEKAILQQERLRQSILKTKLAEEKLTTQKRKTELEARRLKNTTDQTTSSTSRLLRTVKQLASTYLGIMGVRAMINTSDTITSAENRLNNLEGGNANLTQSSMDKIYAASQRSRSGYGDMLSNVSKSMTLAGDAFQGNIDNAIKFQEIMAKAYTVGGASAAEASSSMYQLVQALGSGVLQGDELRSVREGAPLAYKAIEEFCQGVLDTDMSLKDLASEGVVTSNMVVAAIMDMENGVDNINDKFENTSMTFAQAWNQIKNTAIKAFEPVLQRLNEILNSDTGKKAIAEIAKALVVLANVTMWLLSVFAAVINWCVENWGWLKYVILGVIIVLIASFIMLKWEAIKSAVMTAAAWVSANWGLLLIVAAIMAILYCFELMKQGALTMTEFLCWCALIIAIAFLIAGIIMGNIPMLVIAAILALLVIVFLFFEYVCYGAAWLAAVIVDILSGLWNVIVWILQAIISGVVWLCVTIINIIVGVLNGVIQLVWTIFVEPFIGIIEFILNCCNGGFNNLGDACANLIGQIISWFLSLGKVVTKIIDAIFGTDWTSGLNSLQDSVLKWGKNDGAITLTREAPEIGRIDATDAVSATWNSMAGLHTGFVDANQWGSAAGDWGAGIKDSINDWGSQFQTSGGDTNSWLDGLLNGTNNLLGDSYDPAGANDDIADALDKIGGDTGDIADSMELTQEDLEYLRRIADMEWKKEFTTANITVDMSNYNTINGDSDLDGIVDKLADKLYDEMNAVANGVYV